MSIIWDYQVQPARPQVDCPCGRYWGCGYLDAGYECPIALMPRHPKGIRHENLIFPPTAEPPPDWEQRPERLEYKKKTGDVP